MCLCVRTRVRMRVRACSISCVLCQMCVCMCAYVEWECFVDVNNHGVVYCAYMGGTFKGATQL
jgi:hypothetical protein